MTTAENNLDRLRAELSKLENTVIEVDGKQLKPSACYYVGENPLHVLYNTNCPDILKDTIDSIIAKYKPIDESSSY